MGVSLPCSCAARCVWKWTAWDQAGETSSNEIVAAAKFFKISPLRLLLGLCSPVTLVSVWVSCEEVSSSIDSTCLSIFFTLNFYCCPVNCISFWDLLVIALWPTMERAEGTAQDFINQLVIIIPSVSLKDAKEIWVVFERAEAAVPYA